jgi:hypothetical protein
LYITQLTTPHHHSPYLPAQSETEQFNKAIKGVKSRARALQQQGMSAKVAQKLAQKEVTGVS